MQTREASCAQDKKGPCGSSRLVTGAQHPPGEAGTGRGQREVQPSGEGQGFCSGAGTCWMLPQPSGVQGGLRNGGNAALGAHQGAEESAQKRYVRCLQQRF